MNNQNKRRLVKDVSEIIKSPLNEDGIYYSHDEEDMLKGYAMIVGREDTLYSHGYYFFTFDFPKEYPFLPPKVTFFQPDKGTRFHPNLYVSGKVCLSILNTWNGPGWSSCENIKSVLLQLVSILDKEPFLREPGVKREHPSFDIYHEIIKFKNVEVSICDMIPEERLLMTPFHGFYPILKNIFLENKEKIITHVKKIKAESKYDMKNITLNGPYRSVETKINYNLVLERLELLINNII